MDEIKTIFTGGFEDGFLLSIHIDNLIKDYQDTNWELVGVNFTSVVKKSIESEEDVIEHSAWLQFKL